MTQFSAAENRCDIIAGRIINHRRVPRDGCGCSIMYSPEISRSTHPPRGRREKRAWPPRPASSIVRNPLEIQFLSILPVGVVSGSQRRLGTARAEFNRDSPLSASKSSAITTFSIAGPSTARPTRKRKRQEEVKSGMKNGDG